ncbi:response regulator transcription factor [Amycolatopsis sp. NPDC049688]|uniref:response regulator transcription factor n=1 Tax=Amycolatopsis sp. NPDC049688 TaxID=3154733 RepID=UPI00343575A1
MDDDLRWSGIIKDALQKDGEFVVVGQARSGLAGAAMARELRPRIVLMDAVIAADELTGGLSRIRDASPSSQVIVLAERGDARLARRLLRNGARGYLAKEVTRLELVLAIRSAGASEQRIVLSIDPESLPLGEADDCQLSRREDQILRLVAGGLSNSQIARKLSVTEGTVKQHLRKVFVKLNAVGRMDAVNKALRSQVPLFVGA